jgi:hypothetical protein
MFLSDFPLPTFSTDRRPPPYMRENIPQPLKTTTCVEHHMLGYHTATICHVSHVPDMVSLLYESEGVHLQFPNSWLVSWLASTLHVKVTMKCIIYTFKVKPLSSWRCELCRVERKVSISQGERWGGEKGGEEERGDG